MYADCAMCNCSDKTKLQFEPVENNDKVLYKYLNPNLVAMATMSPSKTLTVILWDMVTGGVLHRCAYVPLWQSLKFCVHWLIMLLPHKIGVIF
jgi:hypothetical protein